MRARRLAIGLALGLPTAVSARDLKLCGDTPTVGCFTTLEEAVDAAWDGDVILVPTGFHPVALTLIERELTFRADTGADRPALTGDGSTDPILRVIGGSLTIDDLILGNDAGRVLEISDGATVALDDVELSATALQSRGGLLHLEDSALTATGSVFLGGTAMRSGGQIYAEDSDLVLRTSRMMAGSAMVAGGAVMSTHTLTGSVEIEDCVFEDNTASNSGGAALYVGGLSSSAPANVPVTVRGTRFEANRTASEGVVHIHYLSGAVLFEESVFSGNIAFAGSSGLVIHDSTGTGEVRRCGFCGNGSDGPAGDASVVSFYNLPSADVRNSQFVGNTQTAIGMRTNVLAAGVTNNHFVGNIAAFQPVVDVGFGVALRFTDNLVAQNTGTSAIARLLDAEDLDTLELDHNLWWDNTPQDSVELGPDEVRADPQLDGYQPDGRCQYIDETQANERDELWPSWYGAARDAGSTRDTDLDGSPLDIGAFGGSSARPVPDWDDADGDGVPTQFDCNRFDRQIASGLPDTPYDDIDQDCRGDDDFDADDDGFRPAAWALAGQEVDCDDEDARRYPGQPELPSNGIDDDCDGWADNTGALAPGSCTVAPAATAGWGLLVVGLAARRRRRAR